MSAKKSLPPLTPRRSRPGLFSLDVSSLSVKDAQPQLEHPIFSLSKRPGLRPREYLSPDDRIKVEIDPHRTGLPTIWDKDLLIFAISDIRARLERGEEVSPRIRFHTIDVIEFCQRTKGGAAYARLDRALRRLAGALITTNIRTGGIATTDYFHIIDKATIKRQYDEPDGRLIYCEFTLSDWLFRAVCCENEILTLHPDYFRLRRALDRRLYEIARKHCGRQAEWAIGIEKLRIKCGSATPLRDFRYRLRKLSAGEGDLLEYDMDLRRGRRGQGLVVFRRREGGYLERDPTVRPAGEVRLAGSVAAEARRRCGNDVDLAAAERDWQSWMAKKQIRPVNPEAMFLAFLETWTESRPKAADNDAPEKRGWILELAEAWWDSLSADERTAWRARVGGRVELSDGTGWFRDEKSMAQEAFHHVCPKCAPFPLSIPPPVIAYAAGKAGVVIDEAEHDAFIRFVADYLRGRPYLEDIWRGCLLDMAKNFDSRRASARPRRGQPASDPGQMPGMDPETENLIRSYVQFGLPSIVMALFNKHMKKQDQPAPRDRRAALADWLESRKNDENFMDYVIFLTDMVYDHQELGDGSDDNQAAF